MLVVVVVDAFVVVADPSLVSADFVIMTTQKTNKQTNKQTSLKSYFYIIFCNAISLADDIFDVLPVGY